MSMTTTTRFVRYYYQQLAMSQRMDYMWIVVLLFFELLLGILIIQKVAYTEIDWIAYMQEVSGWRRDDNNNNNNKQQDDDGSGSNNVSCCEYDYRNLYGDTGPLVYPAGFLYLFWWLRSVSEHGMNVRKVQYIFLFMYLATQAVVWLIYQKVLDSKKERHQQQRQRQRQRQQTSTTTSSSSCCSLPMAHYIWSWRLSMTCLCLSKRMHSIFMLRLFNDGPTMLLLYSAILLFAHHRWNAGCIVFSLAVSCKMNVLLFAPGLLLLLLQASRDFWNSVVLQRLGLCCALPQLVLGAPFLWRFPESYLRKAFELDRVFFYQWTVNFKFLPEAIFVSKPWALTLMACHLGTLTFFLAFRWLQQTAQEQQCNTTTWTTATTTATTAAVRKKQQPPSQPQQVLFVQDKQLSPEYIVYTLVVSNFVGIVFARTLHYQFYSWYFHSLPLLLWCNDDIPCDDDDDTDDNNNDERSQQDTGSSGQRKSLSTVKTAPSSSSSSSSLSYPIVIRILLLVAIECAFLTFPATATSSMLLQMAHFAILWQIRPPQHVFSIPPSHDQGQQVQEQQQQQQHDFKKQN